MKKLLIPAVAALLAACGGSANTAEFQAAAPTFSDVSLAQNDADNVEPAAMPQSDPGTGALTATDCHPHLFVRTHEVVERINRHFAKQLRHIERAIHNNPTLADGQSHVWESVDNGVDRKFTMTRSADGATYDFTLTLNGTTVATGEITVSATERKGTMTFDYSALNSVISTEKATGQIAASFDFVKDATKPAPGVKKSETITLTNFLPEEGDPHGPRSGSYQHVQEPGVGGLLSFQDSVILLCPSNPSSLAADVTAVARWYKAADGAVHGRSDAMATGGQIPSGDKWVGVTCAQGQTTTQPAEGYWMMKEEDAGGATVQGNASSTGSCDAVFGAVPDLNSSANDYSFSATLSFPNQW